MGRKPIKRACSALAILFSMVALPASAVAGVAEEAERQAGFAATELDNGDYHRALKSAESALRLDPTRYDMFLVKARAYEALGDLTLAESLVLAYGELLGGLDGREEAEALLERLRGARETSGKPRKKDRQPRSAAITPEAVPLTAPVGLDPEPYRKRVLAALSEGQCNAAASAATELTMTAPEVAEGWRLLGDATRCRDDLRNALVAYRRYTHLGGNEPSTLAMIDQVAAMFGTVLVRVEAPSEAAPVRARIPIGRADVWSEPTPEGLLRLRDLPTGQPFSLTVSGRGLRPEGVRVEPLSAGEVRELTVEPEWMGLATVQVGEFQDDIAVTLLTEDAEIEASPGGNYTISAASAYAQVSSEFGALSTALAVGPDTAIEFDPKAWLPARLAVVGLPAGATVSVAFKGAETAPISVVLPAEVGTIDLDKGVRVAPVRHLDSLLGGVGTLTVDHPTLGGREAQVVVEAGKLNAYKFEWREMPGVTSAVEKFVAREAEAKLLRRGRGRTAALGVASGVLAGVGAGLLAGALVQQAAAGVARDDTVAAFQAGDSVGITSGTEAFKAARSAEQGLAVGAGVGFGLAGVGFAVTLGSAPRVKPAVE